MKIPDDSALTVITTDEVREVFVFHAQEFDGEDAVVAGNMFDAWLQSVRVANFDDGFSEAFNL